MGRSRKKNCELVNNMVWESYRCPFSSLSHSSEGLPPSSDGATWIGKGIWNHDFFRCLTMTSEVIDNYIQDVLRPASISFPFVPITIQVLLYMMFHFFSLYWNNLAVIPTLLQYKGTIPFLHRTGKGQFSLQSQRKEMQKNAQTTTQLHSSLTLVK